MRGFSPCCPSSHSRRKLGANSEKVLALWLFSCCSWFFAICLRSLHVSLVDVACLGCYTQSSTHTHPRALSGEAAHFCSLSRIRIMNLGFLEALETMEMNAIQLVLQADKDTRRVVLVLGLVGLSMRSHSIVLFNPWLLGRKFKTKQKKNSFPQISVLAKCFVYVCIPG